MKRISIGLYGAVMCGCLLLTGCATAGHQMPAHEFAESGAACANGSCSASPANCTNGSCQASQGSCSSGSCSASAKHAGALY
ncbi:hypothetical protein [Symmachiella dynata]|uniref:Lipoprotein n=1 Tax=Symmachiella dynata TaxID=2527995 RepID=A0A517ZR02_9PLAN|nr:hypothetical protein [Symmachiella dynata]QDU44919.1 hypothetical protein Mal52_34050 [Symmachiella dynata]